MYGYIYLRKNIITQKLYVGKHKYNFPELDETYRGSGKLLQCALDKYGEENFTYELVDIAESLSELNELEKLYIKLFDCQAPKGYNISLGGDGGDTYTNRTPEEKEEVSARMRARKGTFTTMHKGDTQLAVKLEDIDKYVEQGYTFGVTNENREKNRQARLLFLETHPDWKPKGIWEKGNVPWNLGVPMRDDAKEKLRKTNTGKKQSPETVAKRNATHARMRANGWNPLKNAKPGNKGVYGVWMWITNGVESKQHKCADPIPDGWYRGRINPKK